MPIKIKAISPDSLATERDILVDDLILEINGNPINDFLDLQFYGSDEHLLIKLKTPKGSLKKISIFQDWSKPLGIEPEMHQCRTCINNCIFCFVDQMRSGYRKSLYIKDDDYRLSFVYGNFITLTNFTDFHIQRIIQQKLSPLYVSVHSTNPQLHKKMLRYSRDFNILESLKQLVSGGIEIHTQIVIVPGWNDGEELDRSLRELNDLGENILSIGIVPVGLTKFRNSLTSINPVNKEIASNILEIAGKYPRTFCSDEIYIKAESEIPDEDFYEGYPQLENGIGMSRMFLENWDFEKEDFLAEIKNINKKLLFITGKSAAITIQKIIDDINLSIPDKARIIAIQNDFFGPTVTVAGLLTSEDILSQIDLTEEEIPVICSCIFNDDDLTLDGVHIQDFKNKLGKSLLMIDEEFTSWEIIT